VPAYCGWNQLDGKTLAIMSNFQSLLRHIPEPSINLFLCLATFGTVMAVSLAWLGVFR
jgi:hypothetical protein